MPVVMIAKFKLKKFDTKTNKIGAIIESNIYSSFGDKVFNSSLISFNFLLNFNV